ncbi:MAG: hypothetical protein R3F46_06215 [bacterium]
MPESLPFLQSVFTSFWGVVCVLGVFFGAADLLKHLGNRMDKRRAMEIFRELMKDRIGLMNNAVQFGADEKVLAELGRLMDKHTDLHQLTELTEIRVSEEAEQARVSISTESQPQAEIQARDITDAQSGSSRQTGKEAN